MIDSPLLSKTIQKHNHVSQQSEQAISWNPKLVIIEIGLIFVHRNDSRHQSWDVERGRFGLILMKLTKSLMQTPDKPFASLSLMDLSYGSRSLCTRGRELVPWQRPEGLGGIAGMVRGREPKKRVCLGMTHSLDICSVQALIIRRLNSYRQGY